MPTRTTYICDVCGNSGDDRAEFTYITVEEWGRALGTGGGRSHLLLCANACFAEKIKQLREVGFDIGRDSQR
jgi:hypothetical protein